MPLLVSPILRQRSGRLTGSWSSLLNTAGVCAPNPGSMSNSCPSLPKSPATDSRFDLLARSVRGESAARRRAKRSHDGEASPRSLGRSVRRRFGARHQHIRRQPLLEVPFNQECFLEPASPPRFHWKRDGVESLNDALLLDHRPVNQL